MQAAAVTLASSTPAQPTSATVALNAAAASYDPPSAPEFDPSTPSSPEPSSAPRIDADYVTPEQLAAKLQQLANEVRSQFYQAISNSSSGANAPLTPAGFAWSQKIDQLNSTAISNPTIIGGSISGASVSGTVTGIASFEAATSTMLYAGTLTLADALSVANGGTGAASFGQGWLYSTGGTGALAASTSPTVNYITATSTTATSTFSGVLAAAFYDVIDPNLSTYFGGGGHQITTGYHNAAFGYQSLLANTSGIQNSAFGYLALQQDTTGSQNTGIGNGALHNNTIGSYNVAVGHHTLSELPGNTGSYNTAVGAYALTQNTTGVNNTGIGYASLTTNTTGANNSALGYQALQLNTTGTENTALGVNAIRANDSGSYNVGIGNQALFSNVSGGSNVAIGRNALYNHTGNNTVGIGRNALYSNSTGANNTALGYQAGYTAAAANANTSGSNSTFLGSNAGPGSTIQQSYMTVIGADAVGTCSNCMILGRASIPDKVGVGTSSPYALLSISNSRSTSANTPLFVIASTTDGTATTTVFTVAASGNVTISGSAATCTLGNGASATNCSSSDQRLKDNITSLDATSSLATILALNPVSFYWNSWMVGNGAPTSSQFGFIAQDVQRVLPNLVSQDEHTGYFKLDYQGLFAPIVGAVKEIASVSGAFKDALIGWLGNAANGIGDFFAQTVHTKKLCVSKSDGSEACFTGDQLATALGGSAPSVQISNPTMTISGVSSTTPPTTTLMGDNPAIVHVGDAYTDLGATAQDSAGHDLGLAYFLNGALISSIVIDTATPAIYTIDYVATDTWGNTSTSTRTVIVEPLESPVDSAGSANDSGQ
jgi:hypothetical protein